MFLITKSNMKTVYWVLGICLMLSPFQVLAERYPLPKKGNSIIGQMSVITTKDSDTFIELARRYGLGFQELVLANPQVDPWLPGEGTQIVVPTRFILPKARRL